MEWEIVALSLVAAAGWGFGSPLSKLGMERGGSPYQVALSVVAISSIVYWMILLLSGGGILDVAPWVVGLFLVAGLVGTAIGRALTFEGVERLGSGINSAAVNTRPVWASIMAVAFLGETVTPQMGVGIFIVVVGLITVTLSKGGDISGWEVNDLFFPLSAAIAFGAGNVVRRFAFIGTTITPLEGAALNETAALLGLVTFVVAKNPRLGDLQNVLSAPSEAYAYFTGAAVVNAFALLALLEALSRGPVVVVDPLSAPSSLFAILFVFIFLRRVERVTRRLIAGALLVIAGVILITGPDISTMLGWMLW
jgi:drug/metabolite transporter (DMT)-like permease